MLKSGYCGVLLQGTKDYYAGENGGEDEGIDKIVSEVGSKLNTGCHLW